MELNKDCVAALPVSDAALGKQLLRWAVSRLLKLDWGMLLLLHVLLAREGGAIGSARHKEIRKS